jgi:hypothetical protein
MPFVDLKEQQILDFLIRGVTIPAIPATNWHVGLSTTTPTEAGGNFSEPPSNYARKAIGRSTGAWNAGSGTAPALVSNITVVTFDQATTNWGTVTHWGLFDLVSAGVLFFWGLLHVAGTPAPKAIGIGDTASFAAGVLKVTAGKEGDDLTP